VIEDHRHEKRIFRCRSFGDRCRGHHLRNEFARQQLLPQPVPSVETLFAPCQYSGTAGRTVFKFDAAQMGFLTHAEQLPAAHLAAR
jgi:hypothetical protein